LFEAFAKAAVERLDGCEKDLLETAAAS